MAYYSYALILVIKQGLSKEKQHEPSERTEPLNECDGQRNAVHKLDSVFCSKKRQNRKVMLANEKDPRANAEFSSRVRHTHAHFNQWT